MKPVTLLAALASGAATGTTRIACSRTLRIDGRTLDCVHPALGHDLDAREAIAHSCNTFFASVARRMSRSALSRSAASLGLPAVPDQASLLMASLGLEGARTSPRRWLSAFRALVASEEARADASVVLDGMRDAARAGSAMALAAHGIDAFAKTGTAPMPGGGTAGMVVVAAPGLKYAVIVVAPGGAGRDAAEIAARVLRHHAGSRGAPASVRVGIANATGYDVTPVALDEYVAGVVDAEAPPSASPALRRLLAIVARTWMERHRDRHAAEGFSVCDLTHCQVFRPSRAPGRAAAAQARGILLRDRDGALTDAAYSASCGGRLETGPDPAGIDHEDAWTTQLDHRRLLAALRPLGVGGPQIQRIGVVSRTPGGRARVLVVHTDRDYTIEAERFRLAVGRALGWQHLKSTWFDVEPFSRGFSFAGRGHGHGRGLCVLGAGAMVARGDTIDDVLAAYYPAAVLSADGDAVDVRVRVSASMSTQRASLERLVHRQAAVLAARLGIAVPARIDDRGAPDRRELPACDGRGMVGGCPFARSPDRPGPGRSARQARTARRGDAARTRAPAHGGAARGAASLGARRPRRGDGARDHRCR